MEIKEATIEVEGLIKVEFNHNYNQGQETLEVVAVGQHQSHLREMIIGVSSVKSLVTMPKILLNRKEIAEQQLRVKHHNNKGMMIPNSILNK